MIKRRIKTKAKCGKCRKQFRPHSNGQQVYCSERCRNAAKQVRWRQKAFHAVRALAKLQKQMQQLQLSA